VSWRKSATPVFLVVLAAGTAAYAVFVDRDRISDAERTARRAEVFPSFRRDDVTRVALQHGAEAVVLQRASDAGSDTWRLQAPPLGDADAAAVDALLRELETATRLRTVDPHDAVGLDAPRATGTVSVGALTYRFALGAEAPLPPGAAYLRVEGEGTFVVPPSVELELLKGADAYRDRRVVPCAAGEISRVTLRGPAAVTAIERHGASFRVIPGQVRASRAGTERLLEDLTGSRVESFLQDAPADGALRSELTVEVDAEGSPSRSIALRLGGDCPEPAGRVVLVRTEPTRLSACVDAQLLATLSHDAAALADDAPLFAHADEIDELRLERPGTATPTLDVARRGSGWRERSPSDRDLSSDEATRVTDLLAALADARGTLADATDGGAPFQPRTRVSVVRTGGETTEQVELSSPAADRSMLLRRADDGALLRLPPDQATRISSILRVLVM
jgi:hypothetical protein